MNKLTTSRLIKSEELNHHGTLFAGRLAEWFVEASFSAAATSVKNPDQIVCLKLHGLTFKKPANKGDLLQLTSQVVAHGKTSITVYCKAESGITDEVFVDGFVTFVSVDDQGKKMPHGLNMTFETPDVKELNEIAKSLR
ncbi:acyl-CoA thioesterase [Acidaminobacter sp. JC074]|uniref:acyl-CoA thioesterase n=1 Tax=Acidaminobacter sp. JC074 TaxID=2530199 RepID=UPI001F10438B|nr:hotdog domain-containing protein [Acidaminobacter sp. JC074]MCH4889460.1 acyl-CoA thioesterase [Acidaminobacter sp. JC074]